MGFRNRNQKISNRTQNLSSQCKVVVYRWNQRFLGTDSSESALSEASRLDISSQVISCTFSKNMANPAGNFDLMLSDSPGIESGDWKDIIKRGDWLIIYMSQAQDLSMNPVVGPPISGAQGEGKRIRCIGYVDSARVVTQATENGGFDISFQISGRDFGVIYEEADIWHNLFEFDKIILDSIATSELNITGQVSIDQAIDIIHDLFFNPSNLPGAKVEDSESLTTIALQWLLPKQLVQDLGLRSGGATYWGSLPNIKDFSETAAGIAIEKPTDYLSGNAWEQLLGLSVPEFHELFTETRDDGTPRIVFRPIPFALNKSAYPTIGSFITLYKDLNPIVEIDSINLIRGQSGEDDYNRYNSFLATVSTQLINTEDNISWLRGTRFPFHIQDSIRRHGFRPMHVTVDSIIKNAERTNGQSNPRIGLEFNELLYDYWNNAVFAESGNFEIIGVNDIKIGKAMKFSDDTPYHNGKRYYIEGYTDTFTVQENGTSVWEQDIIVTRGFEERDLQTGRNFGSRQTEFLNEGEYTATRLDKK